mgnify:CR=1 FL=1
MNKLNNKFAIGCLVQWYEVDLVNEYIHSVYESIKNIKNKENVIVDICFNMGQNLEEIDEKQCKLTSIHDNFQKIAQELSDNNINTNVSFYPKELSNAFDKNLKPYTIADYRREFNDKYCEDVDILMWGETDALIPNKTFLILDGLHDRVKSQHPKYLAFFSTCKMWDDSWIPLEHPDFTDKPFMDKDYKNWWSHHYTMTIDEMNDINSKSDKNGYQVEVVNPFKFNGCGLIMSSDVIRGGANIPKSVFFTHEDTAFCNLVRIMYGNKIPQFVIKNVLLVHNRHNIEKRKYIKGENGDGSTEMRNSSNWYKIAAEASQHNAHEFDMQVKLNKWEDVWKTIK